jgi:hypothetical protein
MKSDYLTRDGRQATHVHPHPKEPGILLGLVEGFGPCSWGKFGTYYAADAKAQHALDLQGFVLPEDELAQGPPRTVGV